MVLTLQAQVPANINTGNPNFPFPQFKGYVGGVKTLADVNPVGVPHAELEQRTRDAYQQLCNSMSYQIYDNGTWTPVTVSGVKYIAPNHNPPSSDIGHCYCVEGDGYYLMAAAYMADKATFDGYYMWIHDREFQQTRRFIDCVVNNPGYYGNPGMPGAGSAYGGAIGQANVRGGGLAGGSPLDGAQDVAMALLIAWKQWGDNAVICTDPCTGAPVTYKQEAIKYIKNMVELVPKVYFSSTQYVPGVIGLDGYRKSGDVSKEMTAWGNTGAWMGLIPDNPGPASCGDCNGIYNGYVDYAAPAYYRSFSDMLTAEGQPSWYIDQYKRGEASDDWIMGQAYSQGLIPWSGLEKINEAGAATTVSFGNMVEGEDFRYGFRTVLNYMWNGAPVRNWNPATHTYVAGTNSYEHDMGLRFASFIKNPQAPPYNNPGETLEAQTYCGPPTGLDHYNQDGTQAVRPGGGRYWPLNWIHGTGAPSAVVSQDFDLMAQMFREAVLKFDEARDQRGTGQLYATAKPSYFHEWFRLAGMLILTGNFHDPLDFDPTVSNMKVYKAVDKTYAAPGDTITYTISYRNLAKADATGIVITDNLPAGLSFISASNGGTASGSAVTWNIGSVPGFVTGGLAATKGSVTLKVKVSASASGRLCNTATISAANGTGWTSNEYPNNITDVMERNCVDIITQNPLSITKKASRPTVMVGDTLSYTIVVKNNSVPFLNGGRPGVRLTFGYKGMSTSTAIVTFGYRIYHGAHEPLINYKNYRVSYFGNKTGPPAYTITSVSNQGCTPSPTLVSQALPQTPTWNHRLKLDFPVQLAAPTFFILWNAGDADAIHQGALMPQKVIFDLNANSVFDWTQDWSYEPNLSMISPSTSTDPFYPIANDWTDPLLPNLPVTKYNPNNCSNNVVRTANKQLAEEWDGYTWRRIYGTAPVSGRELNNIIVKDTLPAEVSFAGFFSGYPVGTVAGNVISWPAASTLNVGDSLVYKFWVTVKDATYFNCASGGPTPSTFTNKAAAKADREQPAYASVTTAASCTPVVVISPSMSKTADKASYISGEVITYTINYKNTSGTKIQGNTVASDWSIVAGTTPMSAMFNAATQEINLAAGYTGLGKGWTYTYSHGTNGFIKGTFDLQRFNSTYCIIMRHNGSTWVEARFFVNFGSIDISIYNMPANTLIGSALSVPFANSKPPVFDFQLQLNNADILIWAGDPGVTFGAIPAGTVTGLPVQAGYAGVRGLADPSTAAKLRNWYTYLDSQFNLQMTDPIPAQLTYNSASNATYQAVNYTGSNVAGTVTWQIIPGPVLYNDQISFVWKGTISNCSPSITNTAFAKLRGISPDPAGAVTVSCNGGTTPVTLLDFSGRFVEATVVLQWQTSNEINNAYFILEKSVNGIDFTPLAVVPATSGNSALNSYEYKDQPAAAGLNYYRLKQVDLDGTASSGKIISVRAAGEEKIIVYPNPFMDETEIEVLTSGRERISYSVKTMLGNLVAESQVAYTNEKIRLGSGLADGVYILELNTGNGLKIFKLVKTK